MNVDSGVRRARVCALVSAALLAAVLTAGGLRSARDERRETAPTLSGEETISAFSTDRDAVRRYELEALKEIAGDESASQEIRFEAQRRRMTLMEWMEKETAIEAVLSARGYDTPVVTVHEDSVNVAVRAESLGREEAGVILELVTRETGVTGGNVKIIPIN